MIELRADPKYGHFFVHTPVEADVAITRQDDQAVEGIKDFISPTIAQRLDMDNIVIEIEGMVDNHDVIRIFRKYRACMNDVAATVKMMKNDKISEEEVSEAIKFVGGIAGDGEDHARHCIWQARMKIYKTDQKMYSPFIKLACRNIVA